jgi:hypothetical protein
MAARSRRLGSMRRGVGAVIVLAPWAIAPAPAVAAVPTAAAFDSGGPGYLGCVSTDDLAHSRLYCVAAIRSGESTAAITVYRIANQAPWVVQAVDTASANAAQALTVTGSGAATQVSLDVHMPIFGDVQLTISTEGPYVSTAQNDTCPIYPLHYEARSTSSQLNPVWRVTGAVSGAPVIEYGPTCSIAFTGATSGMWRVVGAG